VIRRAFSPPRTAAAALRACWRTPLVWAAPLVAVAPVAIAAAILHAAGVDATVFLAALAVGVTLIAMPVSAHAFAAGLYEGEPPVSWRQTVRAGILDLPQTAKYLAVLAFAVLVGLIFFAVGVAVTVPVAMIALPAMIVDRVPARRAWSVAFKQLGWGALGWMILVALLGLLAAGAVVSAANLGAPVQGAVWAFPVFAAVTAPLTLATFFAVRRR